MISDAEIEVCERDFMESPFHSMNRLIYRLRSAEEALKFYTLAKNYSGKPHELSGMYESSLDLSSIADDYGKKGQAHFDKLKEKP